jgi:phenylalanyl-tRNA synthetase alpha subunit
MKEKRENVSTRVKEMRTKFKEKRQELRVKFRTAISKNKKVEARLNKIGNARLEKLLPVIDRLITKTENNTRLTEERINVKIATYNALRDIIDTRLGNAMDDVENTVDSILK